MSAAQPPQGTGKFTEAMARIKQAQLAVKQQKTKAKMMLDQRQLQLDQQQEMQRMQQEAAAQQAEMKLQLAADQVQQGMKAEQQAAAGAQKREQLAQAQANEPILGPPTMGVDGTRPDLDTMPQVGPEQLSVQEPQAMQGMGQQAFGPLAPYLETVRERYGHVPMQGALIPTKSVERTREPNVLSAYEAGQLQVANDRLSDERSNRYFEDLARGILFNGIDDPIIQDELARLSPSDKMLLQSAIVRERGLARQKSEQSPRAIMKDGKLIWVPESESLYESTGGLERAAAGAPRISVGPFDLTPPVRSKVQEEMVGNLGTMEQLTTIERAFKPEFFTTPEQMRQWFINQGKRLGMKQDDIARAQSMEYTDMMAMLSHYTAEELHRIAGATLSPMEFALNAPRLLLKENSPDEILSKIRTLKGLARDRYLRSRIMLARGFDDEALFLAENPQFVFAGGTSGELSRGEKSVAATLAAEQQEAAERIIESGVGLPVNVEQRRSEVSRLAREEVFRKYGLEP